MREWEASASPQTAAPVTLAEAVEAYLVDAKARELRATTLYKLTIIFRKQFLAWAEAKGVRFLKEVDLRLLREFRTSWKDAALAKSKKQERLAGFFWFCIRAGWLSTNPTIGLGKISVDQTPTDYFTKEEFARIVDATYIYRENRWEQGDRNGTRLRALTNLMRWSGLRIRDAITLERSRLSGDSLLLYQAKTRTPVYVPLPPHVAEAVWRKNRNSFCLLGSAMIVARDDRLQMGPSPGVCYWPGESEDRIPGTNGSEMKINSVTKRVASGSRAISGKLHGGCEPRRSA